LSKERANPTKDEQILLKSIYLKRVTLKEF